MANLLGCVIGIPNEITAITLVALGTSLPDMFASMVAAVDDETADNSVGNVTGSNSVNVFLGLGMPWTIGAVYWKSQGVTDSWLEHRTKGQQYSDLYYADHPDGGFMVPAGSLGWSVASFTFTSLSCVALLVFRRKRFGAELGGPQPHKKFHSILLALLWF